MSRGQNRQSPAPKRSPFWSGKLIAIVTFIVSIFAGLAAFSGSVITSVNNLKALFFSDLEITITEASATVPSASPSSGNDYLVPVNFVVVVKGGRSDSKLDCYGELSSGGQNLASTTTKTPNNVAVSPSSLHEKNLTVVNFRLDCGKYGKTPVTPVSLTVAKSGTVTTSPTSIPRPTQSFKVCMGNGGGPSCTTGAAAYYTCDQYNAIGGGAKSTYDTLSKKFCEYKDGDNTVLAPSKVIVNSSLSGGQCGWTTFTVICDP